MSDASLYRYTARTAGGDPVRGSMKAPDADVVRKTLQSRALFVTAIVPDGSLVHLVIRGLGMQRPSRSARLAFFRSFATLIASGVALRRALDVTIERCANSAFREALKSIAASVEHGLSLSEAMARHPVTFPPLYVAMIRAGETGGMLDDVLERLAVLLERDADLRKKLQAALAYPAVVLTAALGLVVFIVARIVPMFSSMFDSFHAELPWTTAVLLQCADVLQQPAPWLSAVVGVGAACFGYRRAAATRGGALALDHLRLRVPVLGALVRKSITARIARMLATLLRAGVELVTAIDVVLPVAGSAVFAQSLHRVNVGLRAGEALSVPLNAANVFDPMFLALVRVGEESGMLDDMLHKVAHYFELDVEASIATLGAVIEPALIVFLGTIVGLIVFSIFLPLYSLIGSVAK
ncbi:MAG: type II secretion system F family protein [Candidatus Velthaea sp.]